MEKRLMTIKELSVYTGIPVNTLYCYSSRGIIPKVKIGRSLKFDKYKIDEWIDEISTAGFKKP